MVGSIVVTLPLFPSPPFLRPSVPTQAVCEPPRITEKTRLPVSNPGAQTKVARESAIFRAFPSVSLSPSVALLCTRVLVSLQQPLQHRQRYRTVLLNLCPHQSARTTATLANGRQSINPAPKKAKELPQSPQVLEYQDR